MAVYAGTIIHFTVLALRHRKQNAGKPYGVF